jgi:hypothetical protein
MADFNVDLQAPQAAGARAVAPVSPVGFGGLLESVADITKMLGKGYLQAKEDEKKKQQEMVISDFVREQTLLNDAMAQGSITQAQAAARARANFSKYSANYPVMAEEFAKQNKALFDNTALGEAKEEEQVVQDRQRQLMSDAQKSGIMFLPSDTPQTVDTKLAAFQQARYMDEEVARIVKRNTEARAQTAEGRAQYEFDIKNAVSEGLSKLGAIHMEASQGTSASLIQRARAGEDPQALINEANAYYSNLLGGINAIAARNPEMAGPWRQMFEQLRQNTLDGISGKLSTEAQTNAFTEAYNKAKLSALTSSPEMTRVAGVSALLNGQQLIGLITPANKVAMSYVIGAAIDDTKPLPVVGNAENTDAIKSVVSTQVTALRSNQATNPEATKQQLGVLANKVLKDVDRSFNDPENGYEQIKEVAKFVSSPDFAYLIKEGVVDINAATRAKQAMQVMYEREVSKAVVERLEGTQALGGGVKEVPLKDAITFTWSGSGVVADAVSTGYLAPMDKMVRSQFSREMQASTKAINQLVHMGAHLEGHTDYAKYWEENKHYILPNMFDAPEGAKPRSTERPARVQPVEQTTAPAGNGGQWWKDF